MSEEESTRGAPSRGDARIEIENLMYLYAEAIDAGDFEAIGRLFAKGRMRGPDGEVSGEGVDGVRAIYERSTKLFEDELPARTTWKRPVRSSRCISSATSRTRSSPPSRT